MKLCTKCNNCRSEITLNSNAETRKSLADRYGRHFNIMTPCCNSSVPVDVLNVYAVKTRKDIRIGAVAAGTLVGVIAGPLGMIIGASAGLGLGSQYSSKDKYSVNKFNNSKI